MLAEVGSCYLFDELQQRMVLRAQYGWFSERNQAVWLDTAWLARGEGITGFLAEEKMSRCISDVVRWARDRGLQPDKWLEAMFGEGLTTDVTCDVVALPLWFRGDFLGIITLHRRRLIDGDNTASKFAVTDEETLREVADICAAHVWALRKDDLLRWQEGDTRRRQRVAKSLGHNYRNEDRLLSTFCKVVIDTYGFECCAALLPDADGHLRIRNIHKRRRNTEGDGAYTEIESDPRVVEVFREKRPQTIRAEKAQDPYDPSQVRHELLPCGAVLPIRSGRDVRGVLIFKWHRRQPRSFLRSLPHHDEGRLLELADCLGSRLRRFEDEMRTVWSLSQKRRAEAWLRRQLDTGYENALRAFSKAGCRSIDLREAIESIRERVAPGLISRRVHLEICQNGSSSIRVQREVAILLQELVTDAVDVSPRGGRVSVRLQNNSNGVEVHIIDSGRSISPAFIERICSGQKFDATNLRMLRLSVIRRVAKSAGVDFNLESASPSTCVSVLLRNSE